LKEDTDHRASHLFTLRVWQEALDDGQSEWRGQVRYVPSGETYYFRQWKQLRQMLRRCLPEFDLEAGAPLRTSGSDLPAQATEESVAEEP
jgi:hypothetical protein